jgi:hypothetical protein
MRFEPREMFTSCGRQASSVGRRCSRMRLFSRRPSSSTVGRLVVLIALGVALLPAVLPFSPAMSSSPDKICIAMLDARHADRTAPSSADVDLIARHILQSRPPDAVAGAAARLAWTAREREWQQRPTVKRVNDYVAWSLGVGACVPEGRHRLIESGASIFVTLAVAACVSLVARYRKRHEDASSKLIDPVLGVPNDELVEASRAPQI